MDEQTQWQELVAALGAGDAAKAEEFWRQFGPVLHRIADKNLGERWRRRFGPEDVAQSVCRTFFRRARGGQLRLSDGESLWALLCAITLNKIREKVRFHSRQKRSLDKEAHALPSPDESTASGFALFAPDPTPAQAAEFADQLEQLLSVLGEEERQILDLKLQDCTNEEVAQRLGKSERTVRRILKHVQARLARHMTRE
jgi:RNA polymerase sigma-70 factor (ECF subfamily)